MDLTEKYEVLFMEKAAQEGIKDFSFFRKKVYARIFRLQNPTQEQIDRIFKEEKLNYDNYTSMLYVAMTLAPIVNYISQPKRVKVSSDPRVRAMTTQMRFAVSAIEDPKINLTNPKAVIDKVYKIANDVRHKPGAQFAHEKFTRFLSRIDRQRNTIINAAAEKLQKHSVLFKQTLAKDVYKGYLKHIELGATKNQAIELTLKENEATSDKRLKKYLQTEAHEDYERAKSEDAKDRGFMYKYWRTQRDVRVRDSHADVDGEIVKQDDYFVLEGGRARYPGDSSLPPEERINCRCTIEYSFIERGTFKGSS